MRFPRQDNPKVAVLLLVFFLSGGCGRGESGAGERVRRISTEYERVISFSPSTTEILFMLGLGQKVVGVTRFCSYPPETAGITRIGGYLDPGYEAIIGLKPDIVLLLPEQEKTAEYLDRLIIKTVTVDNKTIGDILSAIDTIGEVFGVEKRADSLKASIMSRMDLVRTIGSQSDFKPKVLISIGHSFGNGLGDVYVAGNDTYYSELLEAAGAVNACTVRMVKYPVLSAEGIISIDPDIIIELVPSTGSVDMTTDMIRKEWTSLASVKAVREGEVHILTEDYSQIPGPRFIDLLEDIARIVIGERR